MKQYFSYFKIWFILLAVMGVLTVFAAAKQYIDYQQARGNTAAPKQRVYDYAEVLSEKEEMLLEKLIAKREKQTGCDFVIVTIKESVTGKYGYVEDYYWNTAMRDYADDFYDQNGFGYNRVGGDGSLLLDNWYEGEKGTWFSTGGKVYEHYTNRMIEKVLDAVEKRVEKNPYLAYRAYVETVYREMTGKNYGLFVIMVLVFPILVCGVFIGSRLKSKEGEVTVNSRTYVNGGKARLNDQRDVFLRKTISQRKIETSSSGGGRSGRGGGHRSSSGHSHGGGGRRR